VNKEALVIDSPLAQGDLDLKGAEEINSASATPILVGDHVYGSLYVDHRADDDVKFDRDDLKSLVVVSRLISAAAAGSNRFARLDAEIRALSRHRRKTGAIIGKTPQIEELVELIENKIGPTNATVLLTGETGTGKTLVAEAIHLSSKRAGEPFIKINCAAIPRELLESELFGHEKGAFSGATSLKMGLFEAASKGTVFLDEVGELDPSSQAKLLTVLQNKTLQRVGSTTSREVDVRIIAATNMDLEHEVNAGNVRSDLYYRLNVIKLQIPPLRKRPGDIVLLAHHFLARACHEVGRKIPGIEPRALEQLNKYSWPGNVRELANCIERAVIFADDERPLCVADFPEEIMRDEPSDDLKQQKLSADDALERALILETLEKADGNKRKAARMLGWYPQKFYSRLKRYNIV